MKPDVFAAVMATGIVSIAAADHGYRWITDILAVLAVAGLVLLVAAATIMTVVQRRLPFGDITDHDVVLRAFTFVAACAVLDTRLEHVPGVLWVLSAVAMAAWVVLTVLVTRTMSAHGWFELQDRARGAWELASVGTSGLAIVMAHLVGYTGWRWLLAVALGAWLLALAVYCLMAALILGRAFAARLDPDGFDPDAWILMGGLAIATLAGDYIHREAAGSLADAVRTLTVLTWAAATLWIVPLTYFALRRLWRSTGLRFAGVWWAMVFPLGMYSAATFATATETGWPSLTSVSLVFFWVALSTWVAVAVAGTWRLATYRLRC